MGRLVAVAIAVLMTASSAAGQTQDAAPAPDPQAQPAQPAADTAAPAQPQPTPAVATMPAPAPAAPPQPQAAKPWRKNLYTWGSVGTTFAYGNAYGSLNAGAGYMMKHGLLPNLELSYNFGAEPTLWTVRPGVTWFLPLQVGHPYVGAYYTHWFVGGSLPDQDGVGGRAGFSIGRALSVGVTYDRAFNCSHDCDIWTPQVSAGFSL